ncbi:MAG: hypothetical protein AAGI45_02470 [Cyanobacteria bacterium P01_H01_bin.26]
MITLENFQAQLDSAELNAVMESACRASLTSPIDTYRFMQRFVHYARAYSALVPKLCSAIGCSSFFNDPNSQFLAHAERSMDVAAKVFTASIEEFYDPRTGVSHRTLSYALLDKLAEYAKLSAIDVARLSSPEGWLSEVLAMVESGYGATSDDLASLVRAMGFHAAAETIGENECSIINSVLFTEQRHTAFGDFIRRSKVAFAEGTVSPWYWIVIHGTETTTGVEVEHAADALDALNRVIAYSQLSEEQVVDLAGEGFALFSQVQKAFFSNAQKELELRPLQLAIA